MPSSSSDSKQGITKRPNPSTSTVPTPSSRKADNASSSSSSSNKKQVLTIETSRALVDGEDAKNSNGAVTSSSSSTKKDHHSSSSSQPPPLKTLPGSFSTSSPGAPKRDRLFSIESSASGGGIQGDKESSTSISGTNNNSPGMARPFRTPSVQSNADSIIGGGSTTLGVSQLQVLSSGLNSASASPNASRRPTGIHIGGVTSPTSTINGSSGGAGASSFMAPAATQGEESIEGGAHFTTTASHEEDSYSAIGEDEEEEEIYEEPQESLPADLPSPTMNVPRLEINQKQQQSKFPANMPKKKDRERLVQEKLEKDRRRLSAATKVPPAPGVGTRDRVDIDEKNPPLPTSVLEEHESGVQPPPARENGRKRGSVFQDTELLDHPQGRNEETMRGEETHANALPIISTVYVEGDSNSNNPDAVILDVELPEEEAHLPQPHQLDRDPNSSSDEEGEDGVNQRGKGSSGVKEEQKHDSKKKKNEIKKQKRKSFEMTPAEREALVQMELEELTGNPEMDLFLWPDNIPDHKDLRLRSHPVFRWFPDVSVENHYLLFVRQGVSSWSVSIFAWVMAILLIYLAALSFTSSTPNSQAGVSAGTILICLGLVSLGVINYILCIRNPSSPGSEFRGDGGTLRDSGGNSRRSSDNNGGLGGSTNSASYPSRSSANSSHKNVNALRANRGASGEATNFSPETAVVGSEDPNGASAVKYQAADSGATYLEGDLPLPKEKQGSREHKTTVAGGRSVASSGMEGSTGWSAAIVVNREALADGPVDVPNGPSSSNSAVDLDGTGGSPSATAPVLSFPQRVVRARRAEILSFVVVTVACSVAFLEYGLALSCAHGDQSIAPRDQAHYCLNRIFSFSIAAQLLTLTIRCRAFALVPVMGITPFIVIIARYMYSSEDRDAFQETLIQMNTKLTCHLAVTICIIAGLVEAELYNRRRFIVWVALRRREINNTRQRESIDRTLASLLPGNALTKVMKNEPVVDLRDNAAISICEIHDFLLWSSALLPQVAVMVQDLVVTTFDKNLPLDVEKIKFSGSTYISARGVRKAIKEFSSTSSLPGEDNHSNASSGWVSPLRDQKPLLLWGLTQLRLAAEIAATTNAGFQMKVGISSGPVLGALFGAKRVFYDVHGDAVDEAQDLLSKATPGSMLVSQHTFDCLPEKNFFLAGAPKSGALGAGIPVFGYHPRARAGSNGSNATSGQLSGGTPGTSGQILPLPAVTGGPPHPQHGTLQSATRLSIDSSGGGPRRESAQTEGNNNGGDPDNAKFIETERSALLRAQAGLKGNHSLEARTRYSYLVQELRQKPPLCGKDTANGEFFYRLVEHDYLTFCWYLSHRHRALSIFLMCTATLLIILIIIGVDAAGTFEGIAVLCLSLALGIFRGLLAVLFRNKKKGLHPLGELTLLGLQSLCLQIGVVVSKESTVNGSLGYLLAIITLSLHFTSTQLSSIQSIAAMIVLSVVNLVAFVFVGGVEGVVAEIPFTILIFVFYASGVRARERERRANFRDRVLTEALTDVAREEFRLHRAMLGMIIPAEVVPMVATKIKLQRHCIVQLLADVAVMQLRFESICLDQDFPWAKGGRTPRGRVSARGGGSNSARGAAGGGVISPRITSPRQPTAGSARGDSSAPNSARRALRIDPAGGVDNPPSRLRRPGNTAAVSFDEIEERFAVIDVAIAATGVPQLSLISTQGDTVLVGGPLVSDESTDGKRKLDREEAVRSRRLKMKPDGTGFVELADLEEEEEEEIDDDEDGAGLGTGKLGGQRAAPGPDVALEAAVGLLDVLNAVNGRFYQRFSSILSYGTGFASLVGAKEPSFDIQGLVTRNASSLLNAAPPSYMGLSAPFLTLLQNGNKEEAIEEAGFELATTTSQTSDGGENSSSGDSWRVRGSGLIRVHRLQDKNAGSGGGRVVDTSGANVRMFFPQSLKELE